MNIFQKRTVGKKGIAAALLASQLLFTAGCGSGEQRETAGQLDTEQTMQQDGYIVVGYVQVGSESDWRTTNTQSFKDVFTQENGYYLIFEDGQQKQENQVKAIRNLILQEVDYIVLDPIVETGWESVLEEAKEAGIPVILSDRRAEMEDDSLYTAGWAVTSRRRAGTPGTGWRIIWKSRGGAGRQFISYLSRGRWAPLHRSGGQTDSQRFSSRMKTG